MTIVEPGNGGIRSSLFFQGNADSELVDRFSLPKKAFFIVNPRGIRGVARTDTFFEAIPMIRKEIPNAHFLALRMAGSGEAEEHIRRLGIRDCVTLLPALPMEDMPRLFRLSPIMLSLTMHDGLPNVLLEAMACGSYPICGDLESLREWIDDGRNGSLVPAGDPDIVAGTVIRVALDPRLRRKAALRNQQIVSERAEWNGVMGRVEEFYRAMIT